MSAQMERPGSWESGASKSRPGGADDTSLSGVEVAELHAYSPHAETFLAAVAVLSNSRVTFTVDDVLEIMGHPVLGSVGAHGALMTRARNGGQIRPVGFTYSNRTGGIIRVWRGAGLS